MPGYNPKIHHRRSIRLRGYDYSMEGAYFITIRTYHRFNLFGQVIDGKIQLNPFGNIASEQWIRLSHRFYPSDFSTFVIMPNHVHGIIHIIRGTGREFEPVIFGISAQTTDSSLSSPPSPLGIIVRGYKSAVSYRINAMRSSVQPPVWQRNYYEHIIRNEREYAQIKDYINANTETWTDDQFYVSDRSE